MKRTATLPALLALCCLPAFAAPKPVPDVPVTTAQQILQRMDRDNDSQVDFEEYRNAMSRRFHARDADGDGSLNLDEVPKEWLAVGATEMADGTLSTEEFAAHLQPAFDGFDLDDDQSLNNDELAAFAKARAAQLEAKP